MKGKINFNNFNFFLISQVCQCTKENTELCHPWDGECMCKPGWSGKTCSRSCPLLMYGKNCEHKCKCKNNSQCSPINGSCICAAGFRGENCNEECPENTYGEDCAQKCACKNGANCLRENGRCNCTAGENNRFFCILKFRKKNLSRTNFSFFFVLLFFFIVFCSFIFFTFVLLFSVFIVAFLGR